MKILPILLGGDLNCYGMALAFHGIGVEKCLALGKCRLGVTSFSRFVSQVVDTRMETDSGRRAVITEVSGRFPELRPILIGCTDEYASFLAREREAFGERFVIPSPPPSVLRYGDKAVFLQECLKRDFPMPKTVLLRGEDPVPAIVPFLYPAVLKPSVSEEYWRYPFPGMCKVWFPKNATEAETVRRRIRDSGYRGTLLLQERLSVEDADNYVLTTYSDSQGRVKAAAFGHVLAEEHTPRGLGNHAAILTEAPPPITRGIISLLEEIGYRGFANFDFLRHPQSGELYLLEMNLRQGRSNHYMMAAGLNPAGLIYADLLLGEELSFQSAVPNILWYSMPLDILYSRVKDPLLLARIRALSEGGRAVSPFYERGDIRGNFLRRAYVYEHERRARRRAARWDAAEVHA